MSELVLAVDLPMRFGITKAIRWSEITSSSVRIDALALSGVRGVGAKG